VLITRVLAIFENFQSIQQMLEQLFDPIIYDHEIFISSDLGLEMKLGYGLTTQYHEGKSLKLKHGVQ
jgi:hypothetical protein